MSSHPPRRCTTEYVAIADCNEVETLAIAVEEVCILNGHLAVHLSLELGCLGIEFCGGRVVFDGTCGSRACDEVSKLIKLGGLFSSAGCGGGGGVAIGCCCGIVDGGTAGGSGRPWG